MLIPLLGLIHRAPFFVVEAHEACKTNVRDFLNEGGVEHDGLGLAACEPLQQIPLGKKLPAFFKDERSCASFSKYAVSGPG